MAGDWIKMRTDLATSPKVVRLSSALKADRFRIIGGLHSAWSLFDAHSADGKLIGYTPSVLDDLIGWPGFSDAMIAIEWLEFDGENLILPRFEDHNGASAKRRAQDKDRKKVTRSSGEASAPEADEKRTREEKRREEKKEQKSTPPSTAANLLPGITEQVVRDFLAIRKAKKAPLTETAVAGIKREAEKAGMTLQAALEMCCARGWSGFNSTWDGVQNSGNVVPLEQRPGGGRRAL